MQLMPFHGMHGDFSIACRWAQQRGIKSAVVQAEFEGMRGASAASPIEPLDSVVHVPQLCLINEEIAQQSGIVRPLLV